MEIYREIEDRAGKIYIDLVDSDRIRYTYSRLVKYIAKEYNVDSEVLLSNTRIKDYLCDDDGLDKVILIEIRKDRKTAEELRREIKRITRDLEKLVQTLIDSAEKLREQQDLTDWIWKRARYDFEKRRFVKCD